MDQNNQQTNHSDAPFDNNNGLNAYAFSYMDFMQNGIDCSATEFLRNCEFLLPDASFLDNSILGPASNLFQRNHRNHRNHEVNESQVSLASDIYYNFNADQVR
ncbi:unnamed protein product [Rhizopus stolonifer]